MPNMIVVDDTAIAQPAFRTLAYVDGSLNDPVNAAGVAALFDLFTHTFGDQIAWVAVGDHKNNMRPKKASQDNLTWLRDWLGTPDKTNPSSGRINGAVDEALEEVTVPHFRVDEYYFLMIEMSVPDDAEDLVAFADAATEILKTLPVISAVMGMGFYLPVANESLIWNFPRTTPRYKTAIEFMLPAPSGGIRKTPSGFPWHKHPELKPGIADVGWRTFVGAEYFERLPDLAAVQDTPEVALNQLDSMATITAGAAPIWGDVNTGEDISAYRAVAKALAPVRYPLKVALGSLFGSQGADPDGVDRIEAYLNRYDPET